MKSSFLFYVVLLGLLFYSFSSNEKNSPLTAPLELRKMENHAFQAGEKLTYRLHYGLINAGTATLEVEKGTQQINHHEVLHIIGSGQTNSSFDWMYKIRDRYESYIDVDGVFPWLFVRHVDEGGFIIHQQYSFLQHKQTVETNDGKKFVTPEAVQDMLSSFYYARTLDFSKAKIGDIYTITSFVDNKVWPLKIKLAGREVLKVNGQKFNTIKFHPVVQTGRMFKSEEDVTVWVSDDENKIPLLAEGKVFIGSIKMEITHYEGLANPISLIK